MQAVEELSFSVGVAPACRALGLSRASWYRRGAQAAGLERAGATRRSARALSAWERSQALDLLHSERFAEQSPAEIYATLLDEGRYLCSARTMYRLLEGAGEVRERRAQLRHPAYQAPELLATAPRQVWSWDITKLRGPRKWSYFYLYVLLDIYSRYVVGWLLACSESGALAKDLIEESYEKEGIGPDDLTVHMDRGAPMRSKTFRQLLADLEIEESFSRPQTSNDNPFSESQFKTLKYQPGFPDRFGSLEDARSFCRRFFAWYNEEHRHSGIGYLSPAMVHLGLAPKMLAAREEVLSGAFLSHPERFVRGAPKPHPLPQAVWINPPKRLGENRSSALAQDRGSQPPLASKTLVLAGEELR